MANSNRLGTCNIDSFYKQTKSRDSHSREISSAKPPFLTCAGQWSTIFTTYNEGGWGKGGGGGGEGEE